MAEYPDIEDLAECHGDGRVFVRDQGGYECGEDGNAIREHSQVDKVHLWVMCVRRGGKLRELTKVITSLASTRMMISK